MIQKFVDEYMSKKKFINITLFTLLLTVGSAFSVEYNIEPKFTAIVFLSILGLALGIVGFIGCVVYGFISFLLEDRNERKT